MIKLFPHKKKLFHFIILIKGKLKSGEIVIKKINQIQ